MKILVISQYFHPEHFLVNDLCQSLVERGHEVTVLTGVPNYPQGKIYPGYRYFFNRDEDYHGAKVNRVPLIPRGNGRAIRLALNYLSFVFFACLLGPFKCRGKFDLIFVMQLSPATVGLPAILMKWLKKAPILFWVQDLWPESLTASGVIKNSTIISLVRKMMKYIYKNADVILVQSRAFVESISSVLPSAQNIHYLPNWAPTAIADNIAAAKVSGPFTVMFAGNLGGAQNLEVIVEAANRLRDESNIEWVFVGDGRKMTWLQKEVERLDLTGKVTFAGRQPVEKMPEFFAQASCLLVTLRKEPIFELTIPSKVQAYLACGKPMIAALEGEGAKVIEEAKAGIVGPCGDSANLAENVMTLYKLNNAERLRMGENGRSYFEKHFLKQKVLDDLQSIIDVVSPS